MESLPFFLWFIYLFHVQLFFLCSGYLHEKKDKAGSFRDWLHYIGYKLVALGIPYFSFSLITWLLKSRFIDLVNIRTGHLIAFLFTSPALAQYWYLYTLFFLFLFIPNIKNNKILIPLAVGFFGLYLISGRLVFSFALYSVAQYGFWFVLGMLMCNLGFGDLKNLQALFLHHWFLLSSLQVRPVHYIHMDTERHSQSLRSSLERLPAWDFQCFLDI